VTLIKESVSGPAGKIAKMKSMKLKRRRDQSVGPDKCFCNSGQSRGYSEGILGTVAELLGSPERKLN